MAPPPSESKRFGKEPGPIAVVLGTVSQHGAPGWDQESESHILALPLSHKFIEPA